MNTKLTIGRLALAATVSATLFACASATDVSDAERGATPSSDEAITVGGGVTPAAAVPQVPRVLSRSASGSQLVVHFDRAVTAAELPSMTKVQVVRRSGTHFNTIDLMSTASLAADGKSLTMNLTQPIQGGDAYYARSTWKRCVTVFGITSCTSFRADLGEFQISTHPLIFNPTPIWSFNGAPAAALAAPISKSSQFFAAPADAPAPSAGPGTFQMAITAPADGAQEVERKLDTVTVNFTGGHLDCTKTSHGLDGFNLSSHSPDVNAQQLMFENPNAKQPTDAQYSGDLICDEARNRIVFTPPGRLFGDVQYRLNVTAASKEGDTVTQTNLFRTKSPGIIVSLMSVKNGYGGYDTCDDDTLCDVYVTAALGASSTAAGAARAPDTGDYGNMPLNSVINVAPAIVLFQTTEPIGSVVAMHLWAHDTDDTSEWKTILADAGKIATALGPLVTAANPAAGGVTSGIGALSSLVSDLIPTNEDDQLGHAILNLIDQESRWSTTKGPFPVEISNGDPAHRGPITVNVVAEEFPLSWQPQPIIN